MASLREVLRTRFEENTNYIPISGPANLKVNRRYILASQSTYTLPDAATLEDGETVVLSKLDSVTDATINTAGGNITLRGISSSSYLFDHVGVAYFITWNGNWHQVGWGKNGATTEFATNQSIAFAIALG